MSVLEVQLRANTVRGLPLVNGNQSICDEHSLVAKAKSGHADAFGELYRRHRLRAYRTALGILRNHQDAEDAVQRAFQRALVNLERFREDSTFLTWLTRIVINEALMLLRQLRTTEPFLESTMDLYEGSDGVKIANGGPTPEEALCETERRTVLLQAIGRLRENLKVVVLHRELKGLTSVETARLLGLTVTAVKARTSRARRLLRKHLERNFKRAGALSKLQKRKA